MPKKSITKQTREERNAKIREWHASHREELLAKQRAFYDIHREEKRAADRAYYEANREKRIAYQRAYKDANREKVRTDGQAHRAANREKIAAKDRAYYEANHEEVIAKVRAYKDANREKVRAIGRAHRDAHIDAQRAKSRAYYAANPDKSRMHAHNRRARKIGNGGKHTASEWRALCAWFGNVCLRCGAQEKLSVDHVVPLSKGGTSAIDNLQPLCKPCNNRKHTKLIDYRDPELLIGFLESLQGT
jgi:5-methylcytosine-specific restriction endonuclease McrA